MIDYDLILNKDNPYGIYRIEFYNNDDNCYKKIYSNSVIGLKLKVLVTNNFSLKEKLKLLKNMKHFKEL